MYTGFKKLSVVNYMLNKILFCKLRYNTGIMLVMNWVLKNDYEVVNTWSSLFFVIVHDEWRVYCCRESRHSSMRLNFWLKRVWYFAIHEDFPSSIPKITFQKNDLFAHRLSTSDLMEYVLTSPSLVTLVIRHIIMFKYQTGDAVYCYKHKEAPGDFNVYKLHQDCCVHAK